MELATSFRYAGSPARVYAGADVLSQLPREVQRARARRAFVVCGQSVAHRTNLLERVRTVLGDLYAGAFDGVKKESPLPEVDSGVEAARAAQADLIVAVGGGSAVVTARAITILLAEGGSAHELCTKYPPGKPPVSPRLDKPKLPNVAVLTTPTTAANRAGAAVMDPVRRHRLELFDPKARPIAVFLDSEALLTAPTLLCRSTSSTTFCGVVSAFQQPNLNALGHGDLREALELLLAYMPQLSERPQDPEVRLQLATAAVLSNRAADAAAGAGGGVTTGLAHQLQTRYEHIDQGSATSVLLAPGMRFNREALTAGQSRLAAALGARRDGMSDLDAADASAQAVTDFLRRTGAPTRLRDLGVPEADLEAIAQDAMEDFFLRTNARKVRHAGELVEVLRQAW
ncbi:MAG: iron-containing alcohol dehydrogenase [Chloroflexi bacterium]|nr:iron-containing alcohol dehydrogenase [Chloroflexota bacterium]